MSLDPTALNAVHDAIRRDLVRFVQVFAGTHPVSADRAVALARHWDLVSTALEHYTDTQDRLLWPAAREVVPTASQAPLDFIAEKQPLLVDRIAVAAAAFASGAAAGGPVQRQALAESLERLAMLADQHFAYEEGSVQPLLADLPDDASVAVTAALNSIAEPATLVPWLLDGALADRVARVLATLGEAEQQAYATLWKPAYREAASLLW